jgi:dTDP-4-amino-4,6-dideoxygalactose transaminase
MEPIQFVDLITPHQIIKDTLFKKLNKVYDDVAFSSGKYVEEFEQKYAKYCNNQYAIALNSGTSAIHLALLAIGIKKDDEIILPSNTFIGSVWGIIYLKAKPVFIDCNADTYNIDSNQIENKITSKTKAIIGVHLYGQPCDVENIISICKKYKLKFIVDASQAHGALYKNKKITSFGDINCFSFYPSKNLGACGEAGMITTNNKTYYNKIKAYRNHSQFEKYKHAELGFNYRMSGFEAASLTIKLNFLDKWNNQRIKIASYYLKHIKNEKIKLPYINDDSKHVFHLFVIQTKNRNQFIKYLNSKNIPTQIHYPIPCHLQKALAFLNYKIGDLPTTEFHTNTCVSLPMHPFLTIIQLEYIVNVINQY